MQLLWNQSVKFLSIYPREIQSYVHTKTYTRMSIISLLVIGIIKTYPSILQGIKGFIIHPYPGIYSYYVETDNWYI